MLLRDPDLACAAAWAMMWQYRSRDGSPKDWVPTPAEIEALAHVVERVWADNVGVVILLDLLGRTNHPLAVATLRRCLRHRDAEVRQEALGGLAKDLDETDRRLLSADLDAREPWLDPQAPVGGQRVLSAAARLGLPASEIGRSYARLARHFRLSIKP